MFYQLCFHSFEEGKMTWYAAKDRCKAKGGKLVEIDSEEENTALVDEINRRGYIYIIYLNIICYIHI